MDSEKSEYALRIDRAICYCETLLEAYDDNYDIEDVDICHIIEILKGRE